MRAFFGALIGAFAVLLIHPASRPHLLQGLWVVSKEPHLAGTFRAQIGSDGKASLLQRSRIVRLGLGKIVSGKVSGSELVRLFESAQAGSKQDPDNAFWKQSEAVFLKRLEREDDAIAAMRSASFAAKWNDYSIDAINEDVRAFVAEKGNGLAWHSAVSQSLKDTRSEQAVIGLARQMTRGIQEQDIDSRMIVFRNARLIRDGSRSARGSLLGLDLMELVAFGPGGFKPSPDFPGMFVSPKTQTAARDRFSNFAAERSPQLGEEIDGAFRRSDAWQAFIDVDEALTNARVLSVLSVLTSSLPGALVSIGLIGAIVFGFGQLLRSSAPVRKLLTPPWTQILGVSTGVGVFYATKLVFPAIWATVSLASFGVRQDRNREGVPSGYGGAYAVALIVLAVSFSIVMCLYFLSVSPAGIYLSEEVGLDNRLTGSSFALVGFSAVILSIALVTGSVWGFLLRVPSERLAAVSLTKFGAYVCLGCFAAGILLAPPAIAADKFVEDRIEKIFQNEPNFYLTQ